MEQRVHEPTRRATNLDLVITTTPENFRNLSVCAPILKSDHCLVACRWTAVTSTESPTNMRYNFMCADFSSMSTILKTIDWTTFFPCVVLLMNTGINYTVYSRTLLTVLFLLFV